MCQTPRRHAPQYRKLVYYPIHKSPNPISLTAICMKIQIFLTYDAISTGNARRRLLRPSGWRQPAPLKHMQLFSNRQDGISKKTLIFTNNTAGKSNLTYILILSFHIRTSHLHDFRPRLYISHLLYILEYISFLRG
jgi:hypothetical protein